MGDSAGRSAGNRQGAGARRRATPRERSQIDPPRDQVHQVPRPYEGMGWLERNGCQLTRRGQMVYNLLAAAAFTAALVELIFMMYVWFFS